MFGTWCLFGAWDLVLGAFVMSVLRDTDSYRRLDVLFRISLIKVPIAGLRRKGDVDTPDRCTGRRTAARHADRRTAWRRTARRYKLLVTLIIVPKQLAGWKNPYTPLRMIRDVFWGQ